MFLRETVQRCPRCATATPHSRRTVASPRIAGSMLLASACWCFFAGSPWTWAGVVPLVAGAFVLLHDRERSWGIRCERCRGRRRARIRREKPKLDGRTEIDVL